MENIIIRKVSRRDNKGLANLIRTVFDEFNAPHQATVYTDPTTDNLSEVFRNEKSILWVADFLGEPIGCCGVYPTKGLNEKCAELVKFYLFNEFRGKGIGKILLNKSIDSAQKLGYTQLYLESLPHFSGAVKTYSKLGFRSLSNPLGNSGHTACNIWMLKDLKYKKE
ncbi:GNAT family N-acetyltransferase [Psychroserpens algicola]|uniref:GNAT family N-acetyltransferase n=1 Tax=Psychroserpens algicola TaxID=1719034 RepID=A0ABT0H614_9FLAO|nr:GNAT family N-acetyltransferase [Psychroserpens algicola]MCK8479808.1 GNAT family N-acetyltransferase [Psychroserpens algicola]